MGRRAGVHLRYARWDLTRVDPEICIKNTGFYIIFGMTRALKPLKFLGSSQDDIRAMPESVRHAVGVELMVVQFGGMPSDFKSMPTVGAGVYEIRVRDAAGAFRVMYVAKFAEAIYVLHAFEKKTQKTSKADMDLAARRYQLIGA
jgi:phage-related protein